MISGLEGKIDIIAEDFFSLKIGGGISYLIYTPASYIAKFSLGMHVKLFIETIVKEDSITLYGFFTFHELLWFKSLLKVAGVGPRVALSILSSFQIKDIKFAIENVQKEFFTSISGIGEKVATRIIHELKKEPAKISASLNAAILEKTETDITHEKMEENFSSSLKDAVSALENLGFNKSACYSVVGTILAENRNLSFADIIKRALKELK